jgi:hypothetical protein
LDDKAFPHRINVRCIGNEGEKTLKPRQLGCGLIHGQAQAIVGLALWRLPKFQQGSVA